MSAVAPTDANGWDDQLPGQAGRRRTHRYRGDRPSGGRPVEDAWRFDLHGDVPDAVPARRWE